MDLNENTIKEEVASFVNNIQKLLPKKKELIVIEKQKVRMIRLSDIHAETKSVFPQCFFGARLTILREILDKVKLVQQYSYGKSKESYKFFSQIVHKEMEPKTVDDGLLIDSTGSATATYSEVIDETCEMRLTSRIKDLISSETEFNFQKFYTNSVGTVTGSVKDVDPSTLHVVTQWMYQIFPDLSLGAEVGLKPLVYPPSLDVSVSTRFERPSYVFSSTISKSGFQMCFYKQFSPDLRVATIVNEGVRTNQTSVGLALHKTYLNGSELKIFVDSHRCGGFTFQKDILFYEPHNEVRVLRLIGSTLIDRQRRVRFGVGVNLDF